MINIARNDTSILGRWWWEVDRWTLMAIVTLAGFGVMLTLFASPSVAERIGADPLLFVRKQATLIVPALVIMVSVSLLNLRNIRRLAIGLLGITVLLLLATLAFGAEIKGATRWISVGGVTIQPSELAKPAFAVVAATFFSASRLGEDIPGYTMAGGLYMVLLTLLLLQPDVGQAFVLSAIWFTQFFLAGLPMVLVIVLAIISVLGLISAYFVFPHVQSRIDRFLDPASGDNYQVEQAMEAFQNGGIMGTGPGEGVVKNSLPDGHADFILAVAGEEFGLLFCLLIVGIYAFVVLRGFARVLNRNDLFVVLAATGLLVQFGLQALVNMASTLNLIPTKGMTLPFLSYGGSSLIALALGMGMLLAITRTRPGGQR
ncbi:FtsW/RodA/SpoVE family cell cycle protein [Aestuariispira insulae]|uniref:Probable peptidoglycan glycosyltransferase FtsW n=1 Tax=Aestuariispira insulae TaxID=1461337 RepID=A0A3D9HX81_9PROT|nr:putative peptidoglycan glycosyltransferase FtsW [Aestuariispira insulae]RED54113.1 cell division protein FtsW [Aestuariispira insulae]